MRVLQPTLQQGNHKLGCRDGLIKAYRLSINPSLDEVPFQGTSSSRFVLTAVGSHKVNGGFI